jgi:hypothetical protein
MLTDFLSRPVIAGMDDVLYIVLFQTLTDGRDQHIKITRSSTVGQVKPVEYV